MSVTSIYSGIVVEQNAATTASLDLREDPRFVGQAVYQTFYLPDNYVMGTNEQRVPDLSGLQVLVNIDTGYASTATLNYTLEYYLEGSGWNPLISGRQIGNHADGMCWMNLIFPDPVYIDSAIAGSLMRLGITAPSVQNDVNGEVVTSIASDTYLIEGQTVYVHLLPEQPYSININGRDGFLVNDQGTVTFSVQQGVGQLYYTENGQLAPAGELYESDGKTLVLDNETSINFRVLALVADGGTSFLGNEYRNCVIIYDGTNTDTGAEFWMSPPQPSPFAVVSRYFDLRPGSSSTPFEDINLVPNPSFEYDFLSSTTPFGYTKYDNLTTRTNFSVVGTWASSGSQSLRSTSTFNSQTGAYAGVALASISVTATNTYSMGSEVNILSLPTATQGLQISVDWYNSSGTLVSTTNGPLINSIGESLLSIQGVTAPASAVSAVLRIWGGSASSGTLDFEVDSLQFVQSTTLPEYGDGDTPGWIWTSQRGRSPSGPLVPTMEDSAVVVDSVLVDPATPNMAFNVYYSNDDTNDSDSMTEADWEGKLWTRIPKAYICTQRQQFAFPEAVGAKYMKLEFCNLSAQTYYPGTFQQPVIYKKMPTWVADFFITQLEMPSFTANTVNVQDDALTLAYDYYLDDLSESPDDPSLHPPTSAQLSTYFNQNDAADYVDANTLSQINLIMNSYQVPTGSIVDPSTLTGMAAQSINNSATGNASLTAEVYSTPISSVSTVSSLNRESVVFEQSMPVMFFFLTCRHGYKEIASTFDTNKAYFAGTNTIEFLRSRYDAETDQDLYVESGADTFNAIRNDFVLDDDGDWYTY